MFESIETSFADIVLIHAEHHWAAISLVVGDVADLADEFFFDFGCLV